jgi:hypothetical protein
MLLKPHKNSDNLTPLSVRSLSPIGISSSSNSLLLSSSDSDNGKSVSINNSSQSLASVVSHGFADLGLYQDSARLEIDEHGPNSDRNRLANLRKLYEYDTDNLKLETVIRLCDEEHAKMSSFELGLRYYFLKYKDNFPLRKIIQLMGYHDTFYYIWSKIILPGVPVMSPTDIYTFIQAYQQQQQKHIVSSDIFFRTVLFALRIDLDHYLSIEYLQLPMNMVKKQTQFNFDNLSTSVDRSYYMYDHHDLTTCYQYLIEDNEFPQLLRDNADNIASPAHLFKTRWLIGFDPILNTGTITANDILYTIEQNWITFNINESYDEWLVQNIIPYYVCIAKVFLKLSREKEVVGGTRSKKSRVKGRGRGKRIRGKYKKTRKYNNSVVYNE